jgi:hypothetical protein
MLALLVVVLMILGATLGVFAAYSYWPASESAKVSATEVVALIKPNNQTESADAKASPAQQPSQDTDGLRGLVIPKILDEEFATLGTQGGYDSLLDDAESRSKNRRILANRMEALSLSKPEKQAYIDELAAAVSLAVTQKLDRADAINSYMNLKQEKVTDYRTKQTEAKEMRLWAAGVVVSVLFLIAMFSVVLVLLAIERNTRGAIAR